MINKKRNSLEQFIREQTYGPGINGYRFVDIENTNLLNKDITTLPPITYEDEIIDIVPAAVYSTGILFPEEEKTIDGSISGFDSLGMTNNEILETEDDEEKDFQNSSNSDIDDRDGIQLDQMFPKLMGLTCCLNEEFLLEKKISIKLFARYYTKLHRDKNGLFNKRYGLLIETDSNNLEEFIKKHSLDDFYIKESGPNRILFIRYQDSNTQKQINYPRRLREIQKQYAESVYDDVFQIVNSKHLSKEKSNLSNLKQTIYYELKASVINNSEKSKLYEYSQRIERIENICDHLNNLLNINSGGYGLWKSEIIERIIQIENFEFKKSKRKQSYLFYDDKETKDIKILNSDGETITTGLKDIFQYTLSDKSDGKASLSANLQFTRDSRNSKNEIFLKAQLINTSDPFIASQDDSRFYSTFNEKVNSKCFFGVKISISNRHLVPYNSVNLDNSKSRYSEDEATKFLYRQFEDYGIGHGCSIKWNKEVQTIETEYIPTCDTPDVDPIPLNKHAKPIIEGDSYKFPAMMSDTKCQQFKWLSIFSDAKDHEIIQELLSFIDSYEKWIEQKRDIHNNKSDSQIVSQELDKCQEDCDRMRSNVINLLSESKNSQNLEAFRIMNAVMFMQLWHSMKAKKGIVLETMNQDKFNGFNFTFYKETSDKIFSKEESASWRAFQIAFILLNLDGIFKGINDPQWKNRNELVDLVWFPTGGGKTEAYLGIIALTIINRRRLYKERGGGTAAIMRYTLRLLTLQQFQRASLMIMALELVRRWDLFNLGSEPICIGMWVGKGIIPNKLLPTDEKDNDNLLTEFKKLSEEKENKIPYNECPWCNSKLRPSLTKESDSSNPFSNNRLHLHCDNSHCCFTEPNYFSGGEFEGPIPVCLCDETIYLHPPSLLFGTVDKFAQLAHKASNSPSKRHNDSRRIFGKGNFEKGKPSNGYLPPDLIIQDELHLLLGPLGSAVGLFESAIDQLCTRDDGTKPKVISSTATTRNTSLQIAALFNRKVNLFPKPGVDCDDSFFAFYKRKIVTSNPIRTEYLSKRRYMGILPTGRTHIWMQMRLASILMTHRAIFELKELSSNSPIYPDSYSDVFWKAMDYSHTIISYFNSLKEVGKTESQIQSYIVKEVRRVFNRVIRPQKLMHSIYTYGPIIKGELTGRLSGEEVKNELTRVGISWNPYERFAHEITEIDDDGLEIQKVKKGKIPPEFVVATNMISVGLDISRFNTMLVNSMPRNTAEYIQASSRVARDSSGLVLTIHHPFRARDLSHYEKFIEFHEKMYSYVEPISITPFTSKSVDRYLGLYLATIIRHQTDFIEREDARNLAKKSDIEINELIEKLVDYFSKREEKLRFSDQRLRQLLQTKDVEFIRNWIGQAFIDWEDELNKTVTEEKEFVFNNKSAKSKKPQEQLYVDIDEYEGNIHSKKWQIPMSLRVIDPEAAVKIDSN